jgi:basic membrane lipoprotein Med (substrate-binding protein (PBP1-ABC) superfamily)
MRRRSAVAGLLLLAGCGPTDTLAPLSVTVLYPVGGKEDQGLGDAMFEGTLASRVGSDFTIEQHTPESDADAQRLLDEALQPYQGRRLVIAGGPIYQAAVDARACDFQGADVLVLEASPTTCSGLRSVTFQPYVPAFLAGVMAVSAASLAPRQAAGVIAGGSSPQNDEMLSGFAAGVAYAGGVNAVLDLDALRDGASDDPEAIREAVRAFVADQDVVLVLSQESSEDVLVAVRAYNAESSRPVLLVGVDQGLSIYDAQSVLGSILRRYDVEVRSTILTAEAGVFAGGQVVRGYPDGMTDLHISYAYEETPLDAQPFPECDECATLSDAVQAAEPAAMRSAAQSE